MHNFVDSGRGHSQPLQAVSYAQFLVYTNTLTILMGRRVHVHRVFCLSTGTTSPHAPHTAHMHALLALPLRGRWAWSAAQV